MGLRWTLVTLAIYVGLFGLLFLLAQDLAAALLEMELRDPVAFRPVGRRPADAGLAGRAAGC